MQSIMELFSLINKPSIVGNILPPLSPGQTMYLVSSVMLFAQNLFIHASLPIGGTYSGQLIGVLHFIVVFLGTLEGFPVYDIH